MPFKPGVSGNKNGRPKKEMSLSNILQEIGNELIDKKNKKSITYKKAIALKWWQLALQGDITAIINLYRRVDGKERESIAPEDSSLPQVIGFNFIPIKEKLKKND